MHYEVELLNSIIDNDDINSVVEGGGEHVFDEFQDVWVYIREFYTKYDKIPSKAILKDHFSSFEFLDTKATPLSYYLDEAKKQSLSREFRGAVKQGMDILKDSGPNAALSFITSKSHNMMKDVGGLKDTNLAGDFEERVNLYRQRFENPDLFNVGVPSGIQVIDKIWGGWQPGDLICLMGVTASGKTWLSRLFAINAWKAGHSPLVISLEMSKEQEGYRLDTILNEGECFTASDLTNAGKLSPSEYEKWAKEQFTDKPPFYLVTAEGLETANQSMVQVKIDQYRPSVLILDYLNIMEDANGGGTETDRIRNLFRDCKRIAVRNNIPIVAVAAVTMKADDYGTRPPELQELAWSKHATYDCDLILAIHREPDSNLFQVVSRKERRSESFAFYLDWNLNTGKWKEKYDFV